MAKRLYEVEIGHLLTELGVCHQSQQNKNQRVNKIELTPKKKR